MGGFFRSVGKALGKAAKSIAKAIGSVFKAIGSAIGGVFGGIVPEVSVPDIDTDVGAEGVKVTKNGTQISIPVIYGFRRVGGRIIFAETNGSKNTYLYVVYVICEGEIQGVKRVMVQDVELPAPEGNIYTNGQVYDITQGRFSGRMKIQIFNNGGTSSLANESASWSNQTREAPGLAYAVCRYEWKEIKSQEDADKNPYTGGIPTIQFDVLGKKVYDVTQHGGGLNLSTDYSSLTKTSHSYNPVNNLLDYLMNPRYGCGIPKEQINADSFLVAARKCNQRVTYSTGVTGKAITCNAVLSTKTNLFENVKRLLAGSRAFMPFIQGRYKIKIEDGGNAVDITSGDLVSAIDVNNDHILSDFALQGEQKANKFNQVIVRYIDPDKEFTEQEAIYTESADVTADGEDLVGEFNFHTINNPNQAKDIARMIYKKSRNQRYISFTGSQELLEAEPGSIITITNSVLGLNLTPFRITRMSFNEDGFIDVEAREHLPYVYPFVSSEAIILPAQTYKPDLYSLTPLAKKNPEVPISVAPPNDNENVITDIQESSAPDDVTVVTEAPPTDNDILPEAPDITATVAVTRFQFDSTKNQFGDGHKSVLWIGGGFTTRYNSYVASPSTFSGYVPDWGYTFITAFTSKGQIDTGVFYNITFTIWPPEDTTIDTVRYYYYDRTERSIHKYVDVPIIREPGGRQYVNQFLDNIPPNAYIVVRYRNSKADLEYLDGSSDTTAQRTYTNLLGQTVTGNNLESEINYTLQVDPSYTQYETLTNNWNLGG